MLLEWQSRNTGQETATLRTRMNRLRETLDAGGNGDLSPSLNSLKSLVQSVKHEAERSAIATALEKTALEPKSRSPIAGSQLSNLAV